MSNQGGYARGGSTGADNYGQKLDGTSSGDVMLSTSILIPELKLCAFSPPFKRGAIRPHVEVDNRPTVRQAR